MVQTFNNIWIKKKKKLFPGKFHRHGITIHTTIIHVSRELLNLVAWNVLPELLLLTFLAKNTGRHMFVKPAVIIAANQYYYWQLIITVMQSFLRDLKSNKSTFYSHQQALTIKRTSEIMLLLTRAIHSTTTLRTTNHMTDASVDLFL